MNEEVVANTHSFSFRLACSATSRTDSLSASSSDTDEASITSSAEAEYLHLLLNLEAWEGSASLELIKSYETREYPIIHCKRDTVVSDAAASTNSSKHQVCEYTEEG